MTALSFQEDKVSFGLTIFTFAIGSVSGLILSSSCTECANGGLPFALKLGAFNGHVFGHAKMSDPQRADIFAKIVARYDVLLLQEIRDITGNSVRQLLALANQKSTFNYTISQRLGRTRYKEQYAYFYRLDRVKLVDTWQYDDPLDVFEREPYCVRVRPIGNGIVWDFAIVGVHTHPDSTSAALTVKEIGALYDVRNRLSSIWPDVQDVIFMGDFNSDCHYVSEPDLTSLPIFNKTEFHWLIDFNEDTTTKHTTDCAYDRIIVTGPHITKAVVNGSSRVYHFETEHHLDYDTMLHVSDHYPVEVTIH